ncbi:transposase domain-containing protein [Streptosporangium amethystogenes]|uniref:transposase domain-containing protein n=1 Tax=Streptosporangium amethystogenes TaxID=2002 RepID=UPI0012F71397|nr:transposase domain-containing protein [Streptosporangium amethystogenes]
MFPLDLAIDERIRVLLVYYSTAIALFFDSRYGEVWNRLLSELSWARRYRQCSQSEALAKARRR